MQEGVCVYGRMNQGGGNTQTVAPLDPNSIEVKANQFTESLLLCAIYTKKKVALRFYVRISSTRAASESPYRTAQVLNHSRLLSASLPLPALALHCIHSRVSSSLTCQRDKAANLASCGHNAPDLSAIGRNGA